MGRLNEFFKSKAGNAAAVGIILVGAIAIIWTFRSSFGPSSAARSANEKVFICSKTGKSFTVTLEPGMKIPIHSPYSGEDTGYPAELCYWTADGQIKSDPDAVLLNSMVGKPGPTFCPVCKRLVVARNDRPQPGSRPPPTEEEYHQQHVAAAAPADRANDGR